MGAPNGVIATIRAYDIHGNLASVTDPNGNATGYAYDDFGAVVSQQSPVTGMTRYRYDSGGNLISTTDANGATTARTYDAIGRVLTATSTRSGSPTEAVTWAYDDGTTGRFGVGRLASTGDPAGVTTYSYERRGLLRKEERAFAGGAGTATTTLSYDADGNRSSIEYPSSLEVQYSHDYAGRPTSVLVPSSLTVVQNATYLPFGPMTSMTFGNGTSQTMLFDGRYRMTENKLTDPSATTIARYVYSYDAAGNVTGIADAEDANYSRTFLYDDLNRLTIADTGPALWRTGAYTYDRMGNLLSSKLGDPVGNPETGDGATFRTEQAFFTYQGTTPKIATVRNHPLSGDPDGLSRPSRPRVGSHSVGYQTVSYDPAGNELSFVAARTYSPRNLLASVTEPSEVIGEEHRVDYQYDGRGVRLVRSESQSTAMAVSRYYTYSPELQLLSITADDSTNVWGSSLIRTQALPAAKHEFVWFGGRPVLQYSSTFASGKHWYFTDHLGTPILQTDTAATVVWRVEYEPYGDIWLKRAPAASDEGPATVVEQPLRFPGQEASLTWEGTEERYNIFRWYRPSFGRYTQADPLGPSGEAHPYLYAIGNPILHLDPVGLYTVMAGTPGEKKLIEEAMKLLREEIKNNNCSDCRAYFSGQKHLSDIDKWTQQGGPPYINVSKKPPNAGTARAHSQKGAPWSYTWLYRTNFPPSDSKLLPCALASLILHETGHLARQDTGDYEPQEFFNKCKFGCVEPGKWH